MNVCECSKPMANAAGLCARCGNMLDIDPAWKKVTGEAVAARMREMAESPGVQAMLAGVTLASGMVKAAEMPFVDGLHLYIDVVERTFKGRAAGVDPSQVEVGSVYVLDWRAEEPERLDSITVEVVEMIEAYTRNGAYTVRSNRGDVGLEDFASMIVAGPFKSSPAKPLPPA